MVDGCLNVHSWIVSPSAVHVVLLRANSYRRQWHHRSDWKGRSLAPFYRFLYQSPVFREAEASFSIATLSPRSPFKFYLTFHWFNWKGSACTAWTCWVGQSPLCYRGMNKKQQKAGSAWVSYFSKTCKTVQDNLYSTLAGIFQPGQLSSAAANAYRTLVWMRGPSWPLPCHIPIDMGIPAE